MFHKVIRMLLITMLAFTAIGIPGSETPARAEAAGCEAVFSVICEEGYEWEIEFTATEENSGETVTVFVGKLDGYRKSVLIPPGTYSVSARVADQEKECEILVDERPQKAESGGRCCFCALVGSWLYTVENAGLTGIRDENGGPAYFGVLSGDDAASCLMAADNAEEEGTRPEDGPQEIEESTQGNGHGETEAAEETEAVPEEADMPEGRGTGTIKLFLMTGLLAVITIGAFFHQHRCR